MNGENTRSKTLTRKDFLWYMALIAGATVTETQFIACSRREDKYAHIKGKINGASAAIGHQLRNAAFATPDQTAILDTVIIGSGISGLSAAYHLLKNNYTNFKVLELEPHPGGNAANGENAYSAYPLGAHYLPVASLDNQPLLDFLQDIGMITGYDDKQLPVYQETDLRYDPEERLFIRNRWQEGLVPQFGVSDAAQAEFRRFFATMEKLRWQKGSDNLYLFDIPVVHSSKDPETQALDNITMKAYLQHEGYHSEEIYWYLDYCCRDDYGAGIEIISAWAGIHYFASRKGKAANADSAAVLTWPEGNGHLVKKMRDIIGERIQTDSLAYKVTPVGDKVWVDYLNVKTGTTKRIIANTCIMATPQFVTHRLLPDGDYDHNFNYSPWLVANITLDPLSDSKGFQLCWDNVFYKSRSLGYVNAQHQRLTLEAPTQQVLTYYLPLDHLPPADSRRYALSLPHEQWVKLITDDMEVAHPGVHALIKDIEVWIWGHGMIRPTVGFITGTNVAAARESKHKNIFFAHSDLSGISIFEEAFYWGNKAADGVLATSV